MSGYADESLSTRVTATWGHYAPEVLSASVVAAIAVRIRPPAGALMVSMPLALVAVVITSWLLMRRHDRQLCEACMASMPLNAAERAKHLERRFWTAHAGTEKRILIPYLAVLFGSNFFPSTLGTAGLLAWAVIQLSMVYLLMSHVAHRRFQPWCPWCSGGGGGSEHEHDDVTPPLPDNDRQLV